MKLTLSIRVLLSGMGAIGINSAVSATTQMTPPVIEVDRALPETRVLLAQRVACRKVVAEGGTPFYNSFPREGSQSGVLQTGERVGIYPDEQPERGPNGRFYLYVTAPYGSSNPNRGYIPTQYQTRNGEFRSTLGSCEGRKARW